MSTYPFIILCFGLCRLLLSLIDRHSHWTAVQAAQVYWYADSAHILSLSGLHIASPFRWRNSSVPGDFGYGLETFPLGGKCVSVHWHRMEPTCWAFPQSPTPRLHPHALVSGTRASWLVCEWKRKQFSSVFYSPILWKRTSSFIFLYIHLWTAARSCA